MLNQIKPINGSKIARLAFAQLILTAVAVCQTPTFKVLGAFNASAGSPAGVVEVMPGLFYGVNLTSDVSQRGSTIFSVPSTGGVRYVAAMNNGTLLWGPLLAGLDGRLYEGGGNYNQGSGLALVAIGLSGKVSTYPFTNPTIPGAGVGVTVQTPDGYIWGEAEIPVSSFGKTDLNGNVTVVHTFSGTEGTPLIPVTIGPDGNFYGLSIVGTTITVYRMTPTGTYTALGNFKAPSHNPVSLITASNGKLYGTNPTGGITQAGTIYEVSPRTGQLKTIYEFPKRNVGVPALFFEGTDGKLYGTTSGELGAGLNGNSGVFSLDLATNAVTPVYAMNINTQGACTCWMIQGSDGKLYGTAMNLGPGTSGSVWSLDLGLPKPLPHIQNFNPASGAAGTQVLLYGANLLGVTTVSFNGTPTTVTGSQTGKYVYVTVPPGATSGPIALSTPNGSFTTTTSFQVQ